MVKKKFKSTELHDIAMIHDKLFKTKICMWFRVQCDYHVIAPHRLAGGQPTRMKRILQIIDDEHSFQNIPGYHTLYRINREGIIYDTFERKFLIPDANEKTVELEIDGETELRLISRLVRHAFGEPESSDDEE